MRLGSLSPSILVKQSLWINLLEERPEITSHRYTPANCSNHEAALPALLLAPMVIKSFTWSRKAPTTLTERGQWSWVTVCLGEIKSYLMICLHPRQLCQPLAGWLPWAEQSLFPVKLLVTIKTSMTVMSQAARNRAEISPLAPQLDEMPWQRCRVIPAVANGEVAQRHLCSPRDLSDHLCALLLGCM